MKKFHEVLDAAIINKWIYQCQIHWGRLALILKALLCMLCHQVNSGLWQPFPGFLRQRIEMGTDKFGQFHMNMPTWHSDADVGWGYSLCSHWAIGCGRRWGMAGQAPTWTGTPTEKEDPSGMWVGQPTRGEGRGHKAPVVLHRHILTKRAELIHAYA